MSTSESRIVNLTVNTENIKLKYDVIIRYKDEAFYCPDGCEFFMDEHGIQWVKFVPRNGYHVRKEHMVRTELVMVIRNDGQTYRDH